MTRFDPARAAFGLLADALHGDAGLRADVEQAFALLLNRFSTKVYENRFVVGGVAERIIAATFATIGQAATTAGVVVTRTDIHAGAAKLSVKGVFRGAREVRLINVMGDSPSATWDEATILVIAGVGIGYADPLLVPNATKRPKDALLLPLKPVHALWSAQPQWLIPVAIPRSRDDLAATDVASRLVADEIFRYLKRLRPFDTRTPDQ